MSFKSGHFNGNELVKCYRPPRLAEVYEGNHVMLASGGPCMIVSSVKDDIVHCKYEDDGNIKDVTFNIAMLTCFGAK